MRARPVRERHELLRFLAALEAEEQPWLDLFTVLLYVGYRRRAIEAMRWSDLDLVSGTWTVPGERAKNSDPIVLPVVGSALTTLQTRSRPRQAVSFIHLDLADDPYEPLQRHRFGARGALRTGRGTGGDATRACSTSASISAAIAARSTRAPWKSCRCSIRMRSSPSHDGRRITHRYRSRRFPCDLSLVLRAASVY